MIKRLLIFAMGIATGAAGAYLYLNDKYKTIAEEESREAKAMYSGKSDEDQPEEKEEVKTEAKVAAASVSRTEKKPITEYNKIVEAYKPKALDIYLIPTAEFGNGDGENFECIGITYHEPDEVFEDEYGEQMTPTEAKEYLGENLYEHIAEHFGDNEDQPDIVYVRNRIKGVDIEVLRDLERYGES